MNHKIKPASVMNVVPRGKSFDMKLTECIYPFGTLYKRRHVVHVIVL